MYPGGSRLELIRAMAVDWAGRWLFGDEPRSGARLKLYAESHCAYLNRYARPEADAMRSALEE